MDELVDLIASLVRGGLTPQEASRRLGRQLGEEKVREALREFQVRTDRIRTLRDPPSIMAPDRESWYPGPGPDDRFWPSLKRYLEDMKGWAAPIVTDLDHASTKVVSLLAPPGASRFATRGLVLGYVQSGKTANFTAVIAKAADAGYRLFIVLSGTTNSLRNQTQGRLYEELYTLNREHWILLTSPEHDFGYQLNENINAFLTDNAASKTLCVVKKNGSRLRRLLRWLRGGLPEVIGNCPVLLIDDEADQATLNSAAAPDERSKINGLLIDVLSTLPKAAYVGYTATPFANVFVDPGPVEDLYPRDFIVDLKRPSDYFGPERIFGREPLRLDEPEEATDGEDMVRIVPDDDVTALQPPSAAERQTFVPTLTVTLRDALYYFWMATAARWVRGDQERHSTMLVHTTIYAHVHNRFKPLIERLRDKTRTSVQTRDPTLLTALRELWEREQTAVPPSAFDHDPVSFNELIPRVEDVLGRAEIVIENHISDVRLDYGGRPRVYVVVGGNVLSRGLTLEGLIVSYFIRTANAYDTLLQMGRWFGYRPGYEDLLRIWMTDELRRYFYDLATVEREIRYDIRRYEREHLTPLEFGVRIRTHPHLSITSRLKMQHAVPCSMSYSGRIEQSRLFRHRDVVWLQRNLGAAHALIDSVRARGVKLEGEEAKWVFRSVPVELIFTFLSEYQFHENSDELQQSLLRGYIEDQNRNDALRQWNVAVLGQTTRDLGTIPLGLDIEVPLINRARLKGGRPTEYADIKALMSKNDILVDLQLSAQEAERLGSKERDELIQERKQRLPDVGLLLLYPISKDSRPLRHSEKRAPLEAVAHVLGVGLVFPATDNLTPQAYMTVDLARVTREEPEAAELEEEIPSAP